MVEILSQKTRMFWFLLASVSVSVYLFFFAISSIVVTKGMTDAEIALVRLLNQSDPFGSFLVCVNLTWYLKGC